MTRIDNEATVLLVACLTEDRDAREQRAMLDVALRIDLDRGAFLSWQTPVAPELVAIVEGTYEPSKGKRVTLTAADRGRYDRLLERWARCTRCGLPKGQHWADDKCPVIPTGEPKGTP